jgi:CBS domain-containing protein
VSGDLARDADAVARTPMRASRPARRVRRGRRWTMTIRDIMTRDPESCSPDTELAAAAMIMWRNDCGVVPVVSEGRTIGVITDRDICMATATQRARADEIRVGQVMSGRLVSATPDEDLHTALETMRHEQVRRVPVVDRHDRLLGIVSMNDIIRCADAKKGHRHPVAAEEIVRTLRAIGEPRRDRVAPALEMAIGD